MSDTFKHLLHCTDCDEHYYVLTRREDQPPYCPTCGGQEVVDATAPAAPDAAEEGDEE
jgi:rRNA maturation endonuclease Nob1